MKKVLLVVAIAFAAIVAVALLAWINRSSLAARMISKTLHVPVKIQALEFSPGQALIANLWIGNPPRSKTKTSFSTERIDFAGSWRQLRADPLTIDQIVLSQIFVGIEIYDSNSKDNNWARMLKQDKPGATSDRDYLIRRLVLNNLTVRVTQPNGTVKTYPTIPRMEFRNISSATGFPIEEIEKAIFKMVLKDLFQQLNLDQLLDSFNIPSAPIKLLPSLFGG
jgi:hypothetical protein